MRSSGAASTAGRVASGFRHEALLYSGDDEFLERTTQFILDGIERDEAVLTVVAAPKLAKIRGALNCRTDRAFFADMTQVGRNPALIIQAWRDFVTEHAAPGRAVRGIGEPISTDRDDAALVECHIHESLLNVAFLDDPDFWLLCPYDTASLPTPDVERALANHPLVSDGTQHRRSETHTTVDAGFAWPFPGPVGAVESIDFNLSTLQTLRRFVSVRALDLGVESSRVGELAVAVSEIATNAIVHGHGDGTARIWSEGGDRVVCEVHGPGRITDPLIGRVRPARGQMHGHGVWLANQFCDLVQIRSTEQGTTVRLHVGGR